MGIDSFPPASGSVLTYTAGTGLTLAGTIFSLNSTTATAALNVFTSGLQGVVPASGGGTTNFLRADGTWTTPAGGGGSTFLDGVFRVQNTADATKQIAFDASGITTATTRTFTAPNASGTMMLTSTGVVAAQMPALTGDVTTSAGAVATTIAANAVTNAKAAQMATLTIKGNNTGGASNPLDLTVAQVNAILPVFTSALNGSTPLSGGGTANYLRADGTWTAPAGTAGITALTSDVTATGPGSVAATIAAGAVTLAKQANVATASVFYRKTAGTGAPEVQTLATLKTDLGLTGTNSGDQTITLTGDVTGSGTGSFAATIAAAAVTLAKMASVATATVFYRKTAGSGDPEVQTLATLKTDLGLTGTNSGDQTITLTGDVTGSGTGSFAATIAAGAVTNAKQANMPANTIKANTTTSAAAPQDVTSIDLTYLPTSGFKEPVKVISTANIVIATGTLLTIDGYTVAAGDRVLLAGQTAPAENGIYVAAVGAWARSADMTTGFNAAGAMVIVQRGTTNGATCWETTFKLGSAVGTAAMPWFLSITGTATIAQGGTGQITGTLGLGALIGYTTTATAAGTTTLTNASTTLQVFTGSTTQIISLPTGANMVPGGAFVIVNQSTGILTVNAFSGVTLTTVQPGQTVRVVNTGIGAGIAVWFALIEVAPNFTSTAAGTVSASGGGTSNFLRADGTWATPAGGSGLTQPQVMAIASMRI